MATKQAGHTQSTSDAAVSWRGGARWSSARSNYGEIREACTESAGCAGAAWLCMWRLSLGKQPVRKPGDSSLRPTNLVEWHGRLPAVQTGMQVLPDLRIDVVTDVMCRTIQH
jgi:hypothetical protein